LGILVKPKNDKVFSLNAGLINSPDAEKLTPYLGLGMYWKLRFGKK